MDSILNYHTRSKIRKLSNLPTKDIMRCTTKSPKAIPIQITFNQFQYHDNRLLLNVKLNDMLPCTIKLPSKTLTPSMLKRFHHQEILQLSVSENHSQFECSITRKNLMNISSIRERQAFLAFWENRRRARTPWRRTIGSATGLRSNFDPQRSRWF